MRQECWARSFLSAIAIVALWLVPAAAQQQEPIATEANRLDEANMPGEMAEGAVYLYFADPQTGFLAGEMRQIDPAKEALTFYRQIVDELIRGPNHGFTPTLPSQTELRAIYRDNDGTVYVDLAGGIAEAHPAGVRSELLTVYSIVNTLILNVDGVNAVKILINGNEADTLAGHVDISLPLKAQMLLVR